MNEGCVEGTGPRTLLRFDTGALALRVLLFVLVFSLTACAVFWVVVQQRPTVARPIWCWVIPAATPGSTTTPATGTLALGCGAMLIQS